MNWISRAVHGDVRLWRVFWLGYLLPSLVIVIAKGIYVETAPHALALDFLVVIVLVVFYAWAAASLWSCAPNSDHRAWRLLGRIAAGAIVLSLLAFLGPLLQAL